MSVAKSSDDSGMPQMPSIENATAKDGTYKAINTGLDYLLLITLFQAPRHPADPALLCRPSLLCNTFSTMKLVVLFAALCAASPLVIQINDDERDKGNEYDYGESCN
jgi:hypothetical protein